MGGIVRELLDNENNKVYPVTKASATYMNSGTQTVQQAIEVMADVSREIAFPSTDQIIDKMDNGYKIKTTFNSDNSITEVTYDENDQVLVTKKTIFKEDGTIKVEVV